MSRKKPTKKQLKYAHGLLTTPSKPKYLLMREAGFSKMSARVPKIAESKLGFKLAMSEILKDMTGREKIKIKNYSSRYIGMFCSIKSLVLEQHNSKFFNGEDIYSPREFVIVGVSQSEKKYFLQMKENFGGYVWSVKKEQILM